MIVRAVHLPTVYCAPPSDQGVSGLYFSAVLRLLRDMEANGVILIDRNAALLNEIRGEIARWPQEYQARAMAVIGQMHKRHRFVTVDVENTAPEAAARSSGCQLAIDIALAFMPDAVIAPSVCACDTSCEEVGSSVVRLEEYELSNFTEKALRRHRFQLGDGAWTRDDFETQILRPLFQHAERVKIIDRHVGSQYMTTLAAASSSPQNRGTSFETSLEWIYELFIRTSDRIPLGEFEVVCGLDASARPEVIRGAAKALRAFAARMRDAYGGQFSVTPKLETRPIRALPHARYLFTDQMHVLVERGFDLLRRDGRIRDVVLARVDGPGSVEQAIRILPDAP